ncbi:hypothetical protein D0C16_06790 [Cellvibrio sp. KY-GH-1]|uniref:YrhB domain-containing protein n=1 Tax=Cellvibrio sp. KY-GH-1 TaxID=2303332 RepID=UPI001246A413|nr:YrhB domain-containing protein [Cellvibrio sp. KY-GH-1]QEY15701.1 hypothetical protein D0C16_06790 [Cellvibrio sp. KY-GH-1]
MSIHGAKMLLSLEECKLKVTVSLDNLYGVAKVAVSHVREYEWGWLFSYNSIEQIQGNEDAGLMGNAPIIVNKLTGEMAVTGTCGPIKDFIEDYEDHMRETEGFSLEEKSEAWRKKPKKARWF